MRQRRQTLRLHLESRLTRRECAQLLGGAKTTIGDIVRKARAAGVDCAVAQTLSDDELEARLYRPAVPRSARHLEPDYAYLHQELKRPGVTLQLLWEEYTQANPLAYKYTSFCIRRQLTALPRGSRASSNSFTSFCAMPVCAPTSRIPRPIESTCDSLGGGSVLRNVIR